MSGCVKKLHHSLCGEEQKVERWHALPSFTHLITRSEGKLACLGEQETKP